MKKLVEKYNEIIKPYTSLLTFIVFVISTFISIYWYIYKPAILTVEIKKESLELPSFITKESNLLYNFLLDSGKNVILDENFKNMAINSSGFLALTKNYTKVTMTNNSNDILRDVNLKIFKFYDFYNISYVNGDFLSLDESIELRNNISYDEGKKIIFLKQPFDIPPNSKISFNLWGNFMDSPFNKSLLVTHREGEGIIERSTTVVGFNSYLVEYITEIVITILICFIILYIYLIRKYEKKFKNS